MSNRTKRRGMRVLGLVSFAALVAACTSTSSSAPPLADAAVPVVDASVPCPACDASGSVDASALDVTTAQDANDANDANVEDTAAPPFDGPDAGVTTDDASFPGPGCADGTREGLDSTKYPDVATCTGFWTGDVVGAAFICAPGWHVCTGVEPAITAVTYTDATAFPGCFAIDAAQDNYVCHASCDKAVADGVDTAANVDMGAVGNDCKYKFPNTGSCITGGRIDTTENDGYGCNWNPTLTGVTCCRTGSD